MTYQVLSFFDGAIKISNAISSKVYETSTNPPEVFLEYPCTSPIDCFPYEIRLLQGKYFLKVWGAQGCNVTNNMQQPLIEGGTGGHSAGVFIAKTTRTLYLHLGW